MDYQEAIERLIKECQHRIDVITDFMEGNKDADKDKCLRNIEMYKTDISAMQELLEYKKIGTLEEVREAVEKQNECKNCGYKIHSERISKLNSCNDCGLLNTCVKRPEYGECCRVNCYDWRKINEMP